MTAQLLDAIRAAAAGGSVISPATTRRLVDHLVAARIARDRQTPRQLDSLTEREKQVLTLVARGCSNRVISARLQMAELTTKTHVSRVLTKLGLESRVQAVAMAYETGLGLDPTARRATWNLVRQVRDRGATVVLVTHFMEEAEALCDRVAIVDRGRVVALDTPGHRRCGHRRHRPGHGHRLGRGGCGDGGDVGRP